MNEKEQDKNIIVLANDNEKIKELVQTNNQAQAISIVNDNADLVADRLKKLDKIAETIRDNLKDNVDFMTIPGTAKPSLLISGAQKIALIYGLSIKTEIIDKTIDLDNGLIRYVVKAELYTMSTNAFVGQGMGTCSSFEQKWLAGKKNGGPEAENTILKIAEKRAYVDAIVKIGNLSKIFTQDMEDLDTPEAKANRANTIPLTKNEKFDLYTTCYELLIISWSNLTQDKKTLAKNKFKENLPQMLKEAGIEKSNLMAFNKSDKDKFLAYLNEKGTTEKWSIDIML